MPVQVLLHSTSFGQQCEKHGHCPPMGFCSVMEAFPHKCLPCGLCKADPKKRSLTGVCPASCTAPKKKAKVTGNAEADKKAQAALLKEQENMEREERMWRKETEVGALMHRRICRRCCWCCC